MILARRVAMGTAQLDSVHSAVVIRGIDVPPPKHTVQAVDRMGGFGQRVTGDHWNTQDVVVSFAIDLPKGQTAARRAAFGAVCAWAENGVPGWLSCSEYTGKRIRVEKAMLPESADMWKWTDEFKITFRAYSAPYWQDAEGVSAANGSIAVPGHMTTVCGAEITNGTGSTIDSLTVTAGDSQLVFASLGLASGEKLIIDHQDNGLLWMRIKDTSNNFRDAHGKRTSASSDDLYVEPGTRSVSASAGTASFWTYGRYY